MTIYTARPTNAERTEARALQAAVKELISQEPWAHAKSLGPKPSFKRRLYKRWPRLSYTQAFIEWARLLVKQEARCAITGCNGGWPLHIDHDHDTGEVRGLLCNNCNLTLRRAVTVHRLESLLDYLRG